MLHELLERIQNFPTQRPTNMYMNMYKNRCNIRCHRVNICSDLIKERELFEIEFLFIHDPHTHNEKKTRFKMRKKKYKHQLHVNASKFINRLGNIYKL